MAKFKTKFISESVAGIKSRTYVMVGAGHNTHIPRDDQRTVCGLEWTDEFPSQTCVSCKKCRKAR